MKNLQLLLEHLQNTPSDSSFSVHNFPYAPLHTSPTVDELLEWIDHSAPQYGLVSEQTATQSGSSICQSPSPTRTQVKKERKISERRRRNRLASSRYRQRKQQRITELEAQVESLKMKNKNLKRELQAAIEGWRSQILSD